MEIYENFDLTNYNSYRVKAVCKRAIFLHSEEEIVNYYHTDNTPKILLGSGHNVILANEYYSEDFVIFNGNYDQVAVNGRIVEAEAGILMEKLSMVAQSHGLSGIEIFYDIPSSLGGAVVMNAGANGEEIKDVLVKVRYLDLEDKRVKEIDNKDIRFEYRNSFFQRNQDKIVLKAWLSLKSENAETIRTKMESIKATRHAKQPTNFPNAGSVFKRPQGYYVGTIVDELGLKGLTVGGAKVSEKHGGFIINYNNATGQDIIELIETIKGKVSERFGIELEVEQRII